MPFPTVRRATALLALALVLVAGSPDVRAKGEGVRLFDGPYHLEVTPKRHVRVRLDGVIRTPDLRGKEWILVAPVPPDHLWQSVRTFSFVVGPEGGLHEVKAEAIRDASPRARPLERLHGTVEPGVSEVAYHYDAEAVLSEVRLVPGPPARAPVLGAAEREQSLLAGGRYDYETPSFVAWKERVGLRRHDGERDLDFAFRVLSYLHESFHYAYPPRFPRRLASDVCREGASDCGGLSVLFASVLRSEGIPARVLVGRWAVPKEHAEPEYHVRAELWADGVGWVPVDSSGAVSWKGAPASAFGVNRARFFVMHVDPDVEADTIRFGVRTVTWMQTPAFWVRGEGSLRGTKNEATWTVEELPLDR